MMMDRTTNSLLLKANRALSSRLSDLTFVDHERLDEANELFVSRLRQGDLRQASLLRVLLFDLQCLQEPRLIDHQIQSEAIGALSIAQYSVAESLTASVSLEECIATWTAPIDVMGDVYCLASAYYLSDFVRQYWQERLGNNLVWYVCPLADLDAFFEGVHQRALVAAEEEAS